MSGSLELEVTEARSELYAAVPTIVFRLSLRDSQERRIHAIALRCQVQIEARKRSHSPEEQARLAEIFGAPERWGETLRALHWFHADRMIQGFRGGAESDLPVTCTYDFEVAAAKYMAALESGEIPLLFLWSGTIFVKTDTGFTIEQVPWNLEATYRLPVAVWRETMDRYFPNTAWLRLQRDTFDALWKYKGRRALASWEDTVEELLRHAERATEGDDEDAGGGEGSGRAVLEEPA